MPKKYGFQYFQELDHKKKLIEDLKAWALFAFLFFLILLTGYKAN